MGHPVGRRAASQHLVNGEGGGIGIELGDLGDGISLGGIDLDTCRREDGTFETWAREIIDRFASYTEISPSNTGAKIFFRYETADLPTLRAEMGGSQHGREFKRGTGKDHPPAIELHLSNRYFTVTEQKLEDVPDTIVTVPTELLLWVLCETGPDFTGSAKADTAGTNGDGLDKSRSGAAYRLAKNLKRAGKTYEEFVEAVHANPETASWCREKGEAKNQRELRRTWENVPDPKSGEKLSQRDKLISVADRAQFWRCEEGIAHATIPVADHHEHHRVRSQAFRNWLMIEAGKEYMVEIAGKMRPGTFGKNAIEDALSACEAMAAASQAVLPARLHVNQHGRKALPRSRRPRMASGRDRPRRLAHRRSSTRADSADPAHARPALPNSGGSLAPLRALLPIEGDDEWRIVVLWALAALRPAGPYPILAWSGEQGTGKSFASRIARELIDPCGDNIMQPPRQDGDLIAAARNNHVLAFDNLSSVSGELADSLCRLATGGDIGGRSLYTNDNSAAFAAQRPVLLNGIPDLVSRGDLASRTLFVRLSPMRQRRPEAELWKIFNAAAPGILGALLDVLSAALANLPAARLPEDSATFRMADFALLAIAAEPALGWPSGAALAALRQNSRGAASALADLDPVALAIRELVRPGPYTGLISALHARLTELTDPETRRGRAWPKDATRLSAYLRRIAPALRAVGIDVNEQPRTKHGQSIAIVPITTDEAGASPLSESGEERREGEHQMATACEVNKLGETATPATPLAENGGNTGLSAEVDRVAGVAGCSYAEAELHRNSGNYSNGIGPDGVAGVAVTDSSPTPTSARRRIVL